MEQGDTTITGYDNDRAICQIVVTKCIVNNIMPPDTLKTMRPSTSSGWLTGWRSRASPAHPVRGMKWSGW